MDFLMASLTINNLGGFTGDCPAAGCGDTLWKDPANDGGATETPSSCGEGFSCSASEPWLYYANIGKLKPSGGNGILKDVDLKIEVAPGSDYRAANARGVNGFGKNNMFGKINLGGRRNRDFPGTGNSASGDLNEATFIFTLIDQATNLPVEGLLYFAFSYFDFDELNDGGKECLTLLEPRPEAWEKGSSVEESEGGTKFCSKFFGNNADNPAAPSDIGYATIGEDGLPSYVGGKEDVRNMAVTFEFKTPT